MNPAPLSFCPNIFSESSIASWALISWVDKTLFSPSAIPLFSTSFFVRNITPFFCCASSNALCFSSATLCLSNASALNFLACTDCNPKAERTLTMG